MPLLKIFLTVMLDGQRVLHRLQGVMDQAHAMTFRAMLVNRVFSTSRIAGTSNDMHRHDDPSLLLCDPSMQVSSSLLQTPRIERA